MGIEVMGVSPEKRLVRPEFDSPYPLLPVTETDGTPWVGGLHHLVLLSDGDMEESLADPRQAGGSGNKQINPGLMTTLSFGFIYYQPILMDTVDSQPYSPTATFYTYPVKPHKQGS